MPLPQSRLPNILLNYIRVLLPKSVFSLLLQPIALFFTIPLRCVVVSEHKNIIETSWQEENGLTSYAFLESHTTKAAIREIYDSIYDYNDKQKFKANYDALTAVTRQGGPADDNNPTIIDYKCAMDFCRTWLAQIDKASSATKNSSDESLPDKGKIQTRDKLTNFAQQVVSRGVPIQINLGGGKIANSDVDFLIFDFQGEGISSARLETKKSIATKQKTGDDEIRPYNLDLYSEMGIDAEKDTAGLGITYNQKFGAKPVDIDILYQQLEEMVDTRMTLKLAPSTLNSSSGSRSSNQIFTIHLPVLNPFGSDKLEEKQKALIVNAFAKSTQKWLEKYPNLRIKVQLPKNIEQNAIESAYRRAKSSTI